MWLKKLSIAFLFLFLSFQLFATSDLVIKLLLQESLVMQSINDCNIISDSTKIISGSAQNLDQSILNLETISQKLEEYIQQRLSDLQAKLTQQEARYKSLESNYKEVQKQNEGLKQDLEKYKKSIVTSWSNTQIVIVWVVAGIAVAIIVGETFLLVKK